MTTTAEPETGEPDVPDTGAPPTARAWFRRLPVIFGVGLVVGFLGQFFLGLVVIALLISDQTRPDWVRAGGALLLGWWLAVWTLDSTPPWLGALLLGLAAAAFVAAARARRKDSAGWSVATGVVAAACLGLAALNLWPHGLRHRDVSRSDAERAAVTAIQDGSARTLESRDVVRYGLAALASHDEPPLRATAVQTVASRFRFTQTPIWYVVAFEPNPTVPTTLDGEPCFKRSETVVVDALSGAVTRLGVRTALEEDNGCLRLKLGTRRELHAPPA